MIPKQLSNLFPRWHIDNPDENPTFIKLATYMENLIDELNQETIDLQILWDPVRCPANLLDAMAFGFGIPLQAQDSDRTKRKKIITGVLAHKFRGTFKFDAKPRIDAITGYSSAISHVQDSDDAIEMAYELTDPDRYWSTENGYDGSDDNLGTWEIGTFLEYVVAGNVRIDLHDGVHTAVLSAAVVNQVVLEIKDDIVPAYYRVVLGYFDVSDDFQEYAVIE